MPHWLLGPHFNPFLHFTYLRGSRRLFPMRAKLGRSNPAKQFLLCRILYQSGVRVLTFRLLEAAVMTYDKPIFPNLLNP